MQRFRRYCRRHRLLSFLRFLIIAFVNVFQMYSSPCSEWFLLDTKTKLCSGFLEVFPS